MYFVIFNSLAHQRLSVVHLPVSMEGMYQVLKVGDETGGTKNISSHSYGPGVNSQSANQVVSFTAGPLPALGASIYKVAFAGTAKRIDSYLAASKGALVGADDSKDVEASNEFFSVVFDG